MVLGTHPGRTNVDRDRDGLPDTWELRRFGDLSRGPLETDGDGITNLDAYELDIRPNGPTITAQPQSQTIATGQSAILSVMATGATPLGYQWYLGIRRDTSNPIAGATSNIFTTPALTTATSYWVRVTNAYGDTMASDTATVAIGVAPAITTQPQNQTIATGEQATLSVAATGTPPLNYQWFIGTSGDTGNPISGAISTNYTTPALTNTTTFWVRVSNAHGSVNSSTATIQVTPQPPVGLNYFTLTPCRVVDTRGGAPIVGPVLQGQQTRSLPVGGKCGIPLTAKALSINLTATGSTAPGNIRLFPAGQAVPNISTINYAAGQTRANNAVIALNASGAMAAFVGQPAGTTVHLIVDVVGYFQ